MVIGHIENELKPQTPETRAAVALENVADLPRGGSMTVRGDNATLYARRHYSGSWVLRLAPNSQHARWCDNAGQLLEDLLHFYRTDTLPIGRSWF